MAIGATTVWRVRPSGVSTNGGGYDPGISGAATDYSQQNAAQYSASDGALTAGGTTFTSAGAGFTSAMVGNAMQIASGTHVVAGFYFITGFTNSTTVTIDRDCSTGGNTSVAVFKVGGGLADPFKLMNSANATGAKAVPGNTIYILGTGASPDYSITAIQGNPPVSGDTTNGAIRMIADPAGTVPVSITVSTGDNIFANGGSNLQFNGFTFKPTSASNGRMFDGNVSWLFQNCTFNMNNLNTEAVSGSCICMNCEIFSRTGSAPTAFATGAFASGNPIFIGCNFHDLGLFAWTASGASTATITAIDCVFSSTNQTSNKPYILNNTTDVNVMSLIKNCTFDKNSTDAIQLSSSQAIASTIIANCIFSNNTGGSGINCTVNTTALNDRLKLFQDYNDYFNNNANTTSVSLGAHDLTLDPQYANEPSNLTLAGVNLRSKGMPNGTITGNTNEQNFLDLGALQAAPPPVGQIVKVASIGTY